MCYNKHKQRDKFVDLTQDKIDLISKIIRNDRKFPNNEDLFDDFFNETCQRSALVFDTLENPVALETYLRKIVTTSIINVLKDSGRLRRSKSGYMATKELSIDSISQGSSGKSYDNIKIDYSNIVIPKNPEEFAIQQEILEFVVRSVKTIDKENSDKEYLKIYTMRYDKGMTQKEIAQELNISQSEVSKRLFRLMKKVRSIVE